MTVTSSCACPARPTRPTRLPRDHATDVEMLLAYQGRWQRVGQWRGLDDGWPSLIAPTAAAVMGLHGDANEAAIWSETPPPSTSPPLIKWARGGIAELLDAGLVTAGEELVGNRRKLGVRHTARVRVDGTLILADGRVFANPCGATTARGGNHQNGWARSGAHPTGAHWVICERNSARGAESSPVHLRKLASRIRCAVGDLPPQRIRMGGGILP